MLQQVKSVFHPGMGRDGLLIALSELMGQRGALILPHFAHDPGYTNVAQRSFGNSE